MNYAEVQGPEKSEDKGLLRCLYVYTTLYDFSRSTLYKKFHKQTSYSLFLRMVMELGRRTVMFQYR